MAADAAEPPEAAVLSLAPCIVVAPNNSCPVCHITVEGTVDKHCTCPVNKLYLFPDFTTVEPPEVAVSAAEPSEVSVVKTHESSSCPVTAMDAVYESSSCPVTAMDAVYESSSCPVTAMEAVYELPGCSVTATEASFEPLPCSEPAEEAISELSLCSGLAKVTDCELPVCLVSTNVSEFELSILPVTARETLNEFAVCPVNSIIAKDTPSEQSVCPVSINVPSFDLSPGPLPPSVFNPELSLCPVQVLESNIEQFVCPTTLNEMNTELAALSVTAQRPAFAPLIPPVLSQETINAPHDSHVNSVTAIEPIYELSCPVSVSEHFVNCFVFPAMAPETVNALSVLSVSTLPKSLSMPRSSALSVPAWWSSVSLWWSSIPLWSSALPWWSSAQVWWSSALPWRSSAPPRWAPVPSAPPWWAPVPSGPPWWAPVPSAPPWWAPVPSAPSWWAPVPSSLPWLPALPQSPVSPFPHGPGPPSLPLFRLRSTALLDCIGASGSRSLWGGSVTNPVCGLPPDSHQRSPLHHIDSHTTLHTGLHFPSSIALTTHTHS